VDCSITVVSGTQRDYAAGIDRALAASHELRHLEAQLSSKLGEDGVMLLRDVLGRGITVENAAKERGEGDAQRVSWWRGTFRRCLRHLAEITGFAVRNAYQNQQHQDARLQGERERQQTNERRPKKGGERGQPADKSQETTRVEGRQETGPAGA
jgi:hypothetical protein